MLQQQQQIINTSTLAHNKGKKSFNIFQKIESKIETIYYIHNIKAFCIYDSKSTITTTIIHKMNAFIYHEKQVASLCGQHCLNNLLQGPYFTSFGGRYCKRARHTRTCTSCW